MTLIGYLGVFLLCGVLLLRLMPCRSRWLRAALVLVVAGVLFLPAAGTNIAGILLSLFGELSVTSLLLLSHAVFARLRGQTLIPKTEYWGIMQLISVLGLLLYLTPASIDVYALGYAYTTDSWLLFILFAALGLFALLKRFHKLLLIICIAAIFFSTGSHQSSNIWDTFIDAPLFIYSLFFWVTTWLKHRKTLRKNTANKADPNCSAQKTGSKSGEQFPNVISAKRTRSRA